jgi:hypothetical protein
LFVRAGRLDIALNTGILSLTSAAMALNFITKLFLRQLCRLSHRWLCLALPILAAVIVAGTVARFVSRAEAAALSGGQPWYLLLAAPFGMMTASGLRRRRRDRKAMGRLEHSFAHPAAGEVGRLATLMFALSLVIGVLSIRQDAWLGCYAAVMVAHGAHTLSCWSSSGELRSGGVTFAGSFYPWRCLDKFKWMPGNPAILRINHRSDDIRIAWPEDPAIDAILIRHSLARY